MNFRSSDTIDSGEPPETGKSVEIEFTEFSGETSGTSPPVSVPGASEEAIKAQPSRDESESAAVPLADGPPDWFRSVRRILVNDSGAQFRLTIRNAQGTTDVSGVVTKLMTFHRPDGSTIQREAAFYTDGTDGVICYTTIAGDLNVSGAWRVLAHVDFGQTEFQSEIHSFSVHATSPEPASTGPPPAPATLPWPRLTISPRRLTNQPLQNPLLRP